MPIELAEQPGTESTEPEVILAFTSDGGALSVQALPRDAIPNQESIAVILASYINSNVENLVEQAQEARARFAEAQSTEAADSDLRVIASRPVRSITAPDGGLAAAGPVIVGPNGERLQ